MPSTTGSSVNPSRQVAVRSCVRVGVVGALALLLAGVRPLEGQQAADTIGVAVALFGHLRTQLPEGPAAVDPEPFCAPRLVGWRCAEPIRALAEELDLALNAREFTLICTGGPGSCRLLAVRSLVAFEGLEIDGRAGRARVTASLWWRTGAGMSPVSYRQRRITLARGAQGWTVTDPGR
jgi:hypothetical protein